MTQELIYTSAPQGLRPGSRGFCTVVSTQGMAVNLADRLESLSAYRHVFSPQDPNAALNPVVYSHLRITVGGRPYHVLSRIAAAGLDYTQRTNKFAHHVVLDTGELAAAGPAWLMSQPGFMQTDWDGKPKVLPAGRRPLAGTCEPAVCRHWQAVAGDAGWAGVLAESAAAGPKAIATVIYRPGIDVLPLVAEAMALLPPERRWEISFSTYFTKLPPGVDCQWRFVLEGSPEADVPVRAPGAILIDLSKQLLKPNGGPLVEAGRSGQVPAALHELNAGAALDIPSIYKLPDHQTEQRRALSAKGEPLPESRQGRSREREGQAPPLPLWASDRAPQSSTFRHALRGKRGTSWLWIAAVAGMLSILICAGIFLSLMLNQGELRSAKQTSSGGASENAQQENGRSQGSKDNAPVSQDSLARSAYEAAWKQLRPRFESAPRSKNRSLSDEWIEIDRVRKQVEKYAHDGDFETAAAQCTELENKLDGYLASYTSWDKVRQVFEARSQPLEPSINEALLVQDTQLTPIVNEIKETRVRIDEARKLDNYELCLTELDVLKTKLDALIAEQLKIEARREFENTSQVVELKYAIASQFRNAAQATDWEEATSLRTSIKSFADNGDFDQAKVHLKELSGQLDKYNSIVRSLEIFPQSKNKEPVLSVQLIDVSTVSDKIELDLLLPNDLPKQTTYILTKVKADMPSWQVKVANPQHEDGLPIGRFYINSSKLFFCWDSREFLQRQMYVALRSCLLRISVSDLDQEVTVCYLSLRNVADVPEIEIGDRQDVPLSREFKVTDIWPGVSLKLSCVEIDSRTKSDFKSNGESNLIIEFGDHPQGDGSIFYRLTFQDEKAEENVYTRNCKLVIAYLGVKIVSPISSGWREFGTATGDSLYNISSKRFDGWKSHILKRRTAESNRKTQITIKPKLTEEDKKEIEAIDKTLHALDAEEKYADSIRKNSESAMLSKLRFCIGYKAKNNLVPIVKTRGNGI